MLQTQTPPTIEQVKQLAFQLSPEDLLALVTEIQIHLRVNISHEPTDDIDEQNWLHAIASNPSFAFLHDPEEDIYTIEDGRPVNHAG